jgi:hypothetical protein
MTQDEIIEMARQAGEDWWVDDLDLLAFAKLVAQHEREACAEHYLNIMRTTVREAVKREREACAKICEREYDTGLLMAQESPSLAAAIRARGNT